MSPQQGKAVSLTKRWLILIILCAAALLLLKTVREPAVAHSQPQHGRQINGKPVAEKESKQERTSFSENAPQGRWSASFIPDFSRNSSNSPVLITRTSTLMGNEQWRNLQLTHVTLRNYGSKTVLGVQLKWFVTTRAEQTKVLPPPGYTGTFEANLAPGDSQSVECPLVKFSQAIKYLSKGGNLEGDFLVHVRVYQVEFEDGTSWNDD